MPTWTNHPPNDPRGHALQLIRTPANGKLTLAVTSSDMIGCNTHWYGGRTVPCQEPDCDACKDGMPWRWHAYLAALVAGTRHHVLVEFTAQAAQIIRDYRNAHGTLRGCIITACRYKNRHNGRVLINCAPGSLEQMNLPPAPNLINVLSLIWNIPSTDMCQAPSERQMPRVAIAPDTRSDAIRGKGNSPCKLNDTPPQ